MVVSSFEERKKQKMPIIKRKDISLIKE